MNPGKRDREDLRRRAEERLKGGRAPAKQDPQPEPERLVHELDVHRIELEMQNDDLRSSRVEQERALERYTHLFDFAPVGYFVIAADGAIRNANFAGASLVRIERSRLAGRNLDELLAGRDRELFHQLVAAALVPATGESRFADGACELTLHPSGGEERRVRVTASDVSLGGDERTEVLLALEDVTERRRAEEAVREESRHKDEFLATLSHELRNPLGPIRNGLYILGHVPAGGEQAGNALAVIERQLGHLTRIVEDLLDVTRIARGKVQLSREPLELGELVRRTVDDHRAGFESRGLTLDARVETSCWVDGDPTRLVQILGNLLGNAEKFTLRGGRVEVVLACDGAWAALTVRDTGVGIDAEVRHHLFEPFSQGRQSLARSRGGLGLGLSMVKGLVELHGGTIDLASDGPGRGTAFTVRLPIVAAPVRSRPGHEPPRVVHRRILVIEDSDDAAASLRQVLELSGHEVLVAPDGPSGLALARAHRPEVIICDIGLPGMDGYDVARALRADEAGRDAYLIALTGYARPDDARRAAEAGFDRHVGKPPPLEKLELLLADIPPRGAPRMASRTLQEPEGDRRP